MNIRLLMNLSSFEVLLCIIYFLKWNVRGCSNERTVFQNAMSGWIGDGFGDYKSNLSCEWLIESPNPKQLPYISLTFEFKETECLYDYITIIDGHSSNGKLLGTFSGNSSTPVVVASSGFMLINFFSDSDYERSGFNARFNIFNCPNNCSHHGECYENVCDCNPMWFGNDCSFPACPDDCTGLDHGDCLDSSDKRCKCKNGYIGATCGVNDKGLNSVNTWSIVHNYSDDQVTTHLAGHAAVFVTPHLWMFGGYNLTANCDDLLTYNFTSNRWSLVQVGHKPPPRCFHTLDHIGYNLHDYLVLFGGKINLGKYSNELWIYNISEHRWSNLKNSHFFLPPPVCQHSSSVVEILSETYLYIFGGTTETSLGDAFSSDLFRYSWKTKIWQLINYGISGVRRSKLRLAGHSMVYDKLSQSLVVFGGFQGIRLSPRSNHLYVYSITHNYWYTLFVSNAPSPRAFHTGNIAGHYMIIYGGNTHKHNEDESCHNDQLFLYNLRCHQWIQPLAPVAPSGRFLHASASSGQNLLFVHGGYNGAISNQLFVYKLPTFAISLSPAVVCRLYTEEVTCLQDNRCAWCMEKYLCVSKENENKTCSKLKISPCNGVCEKLGGCPICSTIKRFVMNSSYSWDARDCGWCVADAKCHPLEEPASASLCQYGVTESGMPWWGVSNNVMINNTSLCLKNNIPPGFNVETFYASDASVSPDEVNFFQGRLEFKKDHVEYPSSIKVQGFLHILKSISRLQFTVIGGVGDLYLSSDSSPSNITLHITVGNISGDNTKKVILTSTNKKLYYKITFKFSSKKGGKFTVSWKTQRNSDMFQSINYEFLEPYHSPITANDCNFYTSCLACVADLSCAWCSSLSICLPKNYFADQKNLHCLKQDSLNTVFGGVSLEPSSCSACSDYISCIPCVKTGSCEWNGRRCVGKRIVPGVAIQTQQDCPVHCSLRSSCSECLTGFGDEQCLWCVQAQRCFGLSQQIPYNVFGQCALPVTDKLKCVNCSEIKSCKLCLKSFQCGWCSNSSNALQGKCLHGRFKTPQNPDQCVTELDKKSLTSPWQWNYNKCPDYDECNLEWPVGRALHNCSNNATCTNTNDSFLCTCNEGFSGDGVNCHQVCRQKCLNGICSGKPDYRCICNLGWTSDQDSEVACNVDCQCNFHSTCITGIGVCDRCHNNTQGKYCDTCQGGFYNVALPGNRTTCHPCSCNGHGDTSVGICDVKSGYCSCLHNTTGMFCQSCQPGFYGDARSGGKCYRSCDGRVVLPKWQDSGAFGAWRISGNGIIYCFWLVTAPTHRHTIKLTIRPDNINVDCSNNHVFVYDGIPSDDISSATQLAALCGTGGWEESVELFASSGYLTVVYETSITDDQSLGFNATYISIPPSKYDGDTSTNGSAESCASPMNFDCPRNCSHRGACINGLCQCSANFAGVNCEIAVNKILQASYWQREWHPTLHQLSGQSLLNTPPPLYGSSMVTVGSKLWLFGGYEAIGPTNDLFSYDVSGGIWLKFTYIAAPAPRYFHAATSHNDTSMFVFGGFTKNLGTSDELWIFDKTNLGSPKKLTSLETFSTSNHPPALAGHTLTACKDLLLLVGGYSFKNELNRKVWVYNVTNNRWTSLMSKGLPFYGSFGHSSVYDVQTDLLYVYGGLQPGINPLGLSPSHTTYTYSIIHRRWAKVLDAQGILNPLSPSARYLHSASPYDDGSIRGFVLIGGLTTHGVIGTDVWLFRYDCHVWTNMTPSKNQNRGKGRSIILQSADLAYGLTASAVTLPEQSPKPVIYVFGGIRNGVIHNTMEALHLVSPCHTATDKCECEMLRAGCLLCIPQVGDVVCAPKFVVDENDPLCNLLNNKASKASEAIHTQSCSATASPFHHCTLSSPSTGLRPYNCSQIKDRDTCLSISPHRTSAYCNWCDAKCITTSKKCNSKKRSCTEGCQSQQCLECVAYDCLSCHCSSSNCTWNQQHLSDRSTWTCSLVSQTNKPPLPSPPIPITVSEKGSVCPPPCGMYTSCHTCLAALGGSEAGASGCYWSTDYNKCLSPTEFRLRCSDAGSCGFVARPPVSSCPLVDCEQISYCHHCIRQRNCGWRGLNDGSGLGSCTRGFYHGPVENSSSYALWWYMSCPPENECANGHHNCLDEKPEFSKCVDTPDKYECACLTGYRRPNPQAGCQPLCEPDCEHGNCVEPNKCKCNFGFTGPSCSVECYCNGLSDCLSLPKRNVCTNCLNNTFGESCQYCKEGFVGDPTRRRGEAPCTLCQDICNGRSDKCVSKKAPMVSSAQAEQPGPTMKENTICLNCSDNSEGDFCEICKDGYFMLNKKSCHKCECNGHGDRCDKVTGSQCNCWNNTITGTKACALSPTQGSRVQQVDDDCWSKQCDDCAEGFKGDPTDGGQCFFLVHIHQEMCFDPKLRSGCVPSYEHPPQLDVGQSLLFALHPKYTNVDIRLLIDVTEGEIDVYVSDTYSVFNISIDRTSGEHYVQHQQLIPSERKRRSPSVSMENPSSPSKYVNPTLRTVEALKFNNFVNLMPGESLVVRGVRDRLVISSPHTGYNLHDTKFYVVLLAKVPRDVTTDGHRVRRATSSSPARGRLLFRQDQTRIDLFVFFSVFFCCFFLFLSICIVAWKIKQAVDTQQARIAHHMQLQHMASRPFASTYVYIDRSLVVVQSRTVCDRKATDRLRQSGEICSSTQSTPLLFDLSTNVDRFRRIIPKQTSPLSRYMKPSVIKPALSDGNIGTPNSPINAFGDPISDHDESRCDDILERPLRQQSGISKTVASSIPSTIEEVRRHSDNVGQMRIWDGMTSLSEGKEKRDLVVHFQPDSLEHRVPLLHSTHGYLTVVSESDGDRRLTPDTVNPLALPPATTFKQSSIRKSVFRKSVDSRIQQQQEEGSDETSFVSPRLMSRSLSTPALVKQPTVPSSASKSATRVSFGKSSSKAPSKLSKFRLGKKRCSTSVGVGPISLEPTEDWHAGVATVLLQFPTAQNSCSVGLGSAIASTKNMNLPSSSEFIAARTKYNLPRQKRL